jgi:hypothetical protein
MFQARFSELVRHVHHASFPHFLLDRHYTSPAHPISNVHCEILGASHHLGVDELFGLFDERHGALIERRISQIIHRKQIDINIVIYLFVLSLSIPIHEILRDQL